MINQNSITPTSQFRINFHDCDAFGHMNNARYISHFIDARTDHLREFYGFDVYEDAKKTGKNWVVQGTMIRYFYPAKLNDKVQIETKLIRFEKHRLFPEATMRDPMTGKIHATAWIDLTYVDMKTGRPSRHSPELMAFVESIEEKDAEIERFDFLKRVTQILSSQDKKNKFK
jgi:YbgC/YbaW family acyl-CoA thioester hydrolase